jgi:hypothetical protein
MGWVSGEEVAKLATRADRGGETFAVAGDLGVETQQSVPDHVRDLVARERDPLVTQKAVCRRTIRGHHYAE